MARRHDERIDARDDVGGDAGGGERGTRLLGAAALVVVAVHVVDRVVEPERDLDFGRPLGKVAARREALDALAQVLERVVVAVGLAVRGEQRVAHRAAVARGGERGPCALPRTLEHVVARHATSQSTNGTSARTRQR